VTKSGESCLNCYYWDESGYLEPDATLTSPRLCRVPGECRRNPPSFAYSKWPQTFPEDWCGEWSSY
jgi:hypothetical protein